MQNHSAILKKAGNHLPMIVIVAAFIVLALLAVQGGGVGDTNNGPQFNYHVADRSDIPEGTAPLAMSYTPPSRPAYSSEEEAQTKTFSVVFVSSIMLGALVGAVGYIVWRRRKLKGHDVENDRRLNAAARVAACALIGLVAMSAVMVVVVGEGEAATLIVDKDAFYSDEYETFQEAIDAAENGDTILVTNGEYSENILVDKSVTIVSKAWQRSTFKRNDKAVVESSSGDSVFTITANDVVIAGLTINGAIDTGAAGIYSDTSIENCSFIQNQFGYVGYADASDSNNYGIYLSGADSCIITLNQFCENTDFSVKLSACNSCEVYGNDFVRNNGGSDQACDDENGSNSWSKDEIGNYWTDFSGTTYVIEGNSGASDIHAQHIITVDDDDSTKDYEYLWQAVGNADEGNKILVYDGTYEGQGYYESIHIATSNLAIMSQDYVDHTANTGSIIKKYDGQNHVLVIEDGVGEDTVGVSIKGFTIYGDTNEDNGDKAGVFLNGVEHCIVSHNRCGYEEDEDLYRSEIGIFLKDSEHCVISYNTANCNEQNNILLKNSDNNIVYKNTCGMSCWDSGDYHTNTYESIALEYSHGNYITNNYTSGALVGIHIFESNKNKILNNVISGDSYNDVHDVGIELNGSYENLVSANACLGKSDEDIRIEFVPDPWVVAALFVIDVVITVLLLKLFAVVGVSLLVIKVFTYLDYIATIDFALTHNPWFYFDLVPFPVIPTLPAFFTLTDWYEEIYKDYWKEMMQHNRDKLDIGILVGSTYPIGDIGNEDSLGGNTLSYNTCTYTEDYAIQLQDTSAGTQVIQNKLDRNDRVGIHIWDTWSNSGGLQDILILENIIRCNDPDYDKPGILIESDDSESVHENNKVMKNVLVRNHGYGIEVDNCENFEFGENYFVDNGGSPSQASDTPRDGGANSWHDNYWSDDPLDLDSGSHGIVTVDGDKNDSSDDGGNHDDGDYETITEGIVAANENDAVFVYPDSFSDDLQQGFLPYWECISITKSIHLIGSNSKTSWDTILEGDDSVCEPVIEIAADNVTISWFTINNTYHLSQEHGIDAQNSDSLTITNNTFIYSGHGVHLNQSSSTITNNNFEGCDRGVYLENSHSTSISNNTFQGDDDTEYGIYLESSDSTTIVSNLIQNSGNGIGVAGSSSNTIITSNYIQGNSDHGIISTQSEVNAAMNWWGDPSGPGGDGPGTGDAVEGNVDYSPWLHSAKDIDPYEAGFQPDRSHLHVDDDSPQHEPDYEDNEQIKEGMNKVSGSDLVVEAEAGTYYENVVINKTLTLKGKETETTTIDGGGAGDVVSIEVDGCKISDLELVNGGHGIYVAKPDQTVISFTEITNNTIWNCVDGVHLRDSESTSITNNTIRNNTGHGVSLNNTTLDEGTISYNAIKDNGNKGIESTHTVDASMNWWGDSSGPFHSENNPDGLGDSIDGSVDVDYSPWLLSGTDTDANTGFQPDCSHIHVDGDSPQCGDTNHIQEGVNKVYGSDPIVDVESGMYDERITIDKSLTLLGSGFEGEEKTTIDGNNVGDVITIQADGCEIRGFDIVNSGSIRSSTGICFSDENGTVSNTTIKNNTIRGCVYGIYLHTSGSVLITNNIIKDNSNGVVSWDSNQVTFSLNSIVPNSDGIRTYIKPVNASMNWWGDSSGPGGEGPGEGNDVGLLVDYSPWLHSGEDLDTSASGFQPDCSHLHVDGGIYGSPQYNPDYEDNQQIQEGIDCAFGSDLTIEVDPGTYPYERITINKSLSLLGSGFENTIIEGAEEEGEDFVTIMADGCEISGFTLMNAGTYGGVSARIHVLNSNSVVIKENYIESGGGTRGPGIIISNSNSSVITNNEIKLCLTGISILDSDSAVITNNYSIASETGIYLSNSYHNTISYNWISGIDSYPSNLEIDASMNYWCDSSGPSGAGPGEGVAIGEYVDYSPWLHFYDMDGDTIGFQANCSRIHVDAASPQYDVSYQDDEIIQEGIDKGSGSDLVIDVEPGTYNEGNIVIDKALTLKGEGAASTVIDGEGSLMTVEVTANDVTIDGFLITGGNYGVYLDNSESGTIENNRIENTSQAGIYIDSSSNTISENDICNNTKHGIRVVSNSSNNTISNNTIENNSELGVYNDGCLNTVVVTSNWWGHESGPGGEGWGSGDNVNISVDYSPWLGAVPGTTPMTWYTNDSIQDAIDLADGGDTINVIVDEDGPIFNENLYINKSITLLGAGTDTTTISTTGDKGIWIFHATNVSITGFSITGTATHGVDVEFNSTNIVLSGNSIVGSFDYGIWVDHGSSVDARDNWWGSTNGPKHTPYGEPSLNTFNMNSQGERVSDNVRFVPWLDETGSSFAPVENSSSGECFASIQTAITAAETDDIINVKTGTYSENIEIEKSVSLLGDETDKPTIVGAEGDDVIEITASGVHLSGFKITGGYDGIYLIGSASSNAVITNNTIFDTHDGIYIQNSSENLIENNTISLNDGNGISILGSCENLQIHHNDISNNSLGICNVGTFPVNATSNWWGSTNGPDHSSNTFNQHLGKGNAINDGVSYVPWLLSYPDGQLFSPVANTDNGESFASIQDAIGDEQTLVGHTLSVEAGTFSESLQITKSLTIDRAGAGDFSVDGDVTFATQNISLNGLSITGEWHLKQNALMSEIIGAAGSGDTINVEDGTYNETVTIGKSLTIQGETSEGYDINGKVFFAAPNITMTGARVSEEWVVLPGATIQDAIDAANPFDEIIIYPSEDAYVENLLIDKALVLYSSEPDPVDTTISGAANPGEDVITITADNVTIMQLTITGGSNGVGTYSSDHVTLANNAIDSNTSKGIFLDDSDYAVLHFNTITNNDHGIFLEDSASNSINYNHCEANSSYAVKLYGESNENQIYHNNFISTTGHVFDDGVDNLWHDGPFRGGNYWSDFATEDDLNPQDGIIDSPYPVNEGDCDSYPLKYPLQVSYVETGGNIQAAINNCDDGQDPPSHLDRDVIYVSPGSYDQRITIGRWVSLIGDPREKPVIDGESGGNVVTINADGVSVIGLEIINSDPSPVSAGIWVNSNGNRITSCYCHYNWYGIALGNGSAGNDNNTLTENVCAENGSGIRIYQGSEGNVLENNNFLENGEPPFEEGYGFGIYNLGDSNTFMGNTCSLNSASGIGNYGDYNTLIGNTCSENQGSGITLNVSDSNSIIRNACLFNVYDGIDISSSEKNFLMDNTFLNNENHGIELSTSDNNTITHNTIHGNGTDGSGNGIHLNDGSQNNIANYNSITGHGIDNYGIYADSIDDYIIARYNWWGDASGAKHETENPDGEGDRVSDYAWTVPWLKRELTFELAGDTVIYVDSSRGNDITGDGSWDLPYATIGKAIEVAGESTADDIIYAFGGLYTTTETITVDTKVTLIGEGRDVTEINRVTTGDVVEITADEVTMMGFKTRGESAGIRVSSDNNLVVCNDCSLSSNYCGLVLYCANYNIITYNICTWNADYGILVYCSTGNTLTYNECENNLLDGILLTGSTDGVVSYNTCSSNQRYGIRLGGYSCENNTIEFNEIDSNGSYGIRLKPDEGHSHSSNTITQNNFIDNNDSFPGHQAYDTNELSSNNEWNYNYWSDDDQNPGSGEGKYYIDGRTPPDCNKDNYPEGEPVGDAGATGDGGVV